MAGRILSDSDRGKRLVPAPAWDRAMPGASAAKRLPSHMAKRLAREPRRDGFGGDMLGGADRAGAMDPEAAARIAADADGGEFL